VIIRPLIPADDRRTFSCGDPDYDEFLRKYAGQNQFAHHVGVTYVAVDAERVAGYVTVAVGEIDRDGRPPESAGLPRYPTPSLRIARSAVDESYQHQGLGGELIGSALSLALWMGDHAGCTIVVVDSLRSRTAFYEELGFRTFEPVVGRSPVAGTVTMYLLVRDIENSRTGEAE
jgi:GNAT superfamily N-acetyltransferase